MEMRKMEMGGYGNGRKWKWGKMEMGKNGNGNR